MNRIKKTRLAQSLWRWWKSGCTYTINLKKVIFSDSMKKIMILCIVSLFCLTGCGNSDLAKQREKNAGQGDSIIIGVPVPLAFARENTRFLNGIEMALEEINEKGVNGKKVKLEIVDDKGNFKTAVDIAQNFSENSQMVAVIGHWYSDICIPVSKIYEEAGMLTLVPTVSNPEVTEKGYKYVFQDIISDKKIARQMCTYAKSKGYKKVVIYYEESSYGENLAKALEEAAIVNDLKIVDRTSGLVTEEQFKKAQEKWNALEFDAVLIALNPPEGGIFITQLKNMNQNVGIISADGLDVNSFLKEMGQNAEDVVIVTTYYPAKTGAELIRFTEKFKQKFNEEPDVWAIQGYESLKLITHAIEETNSYSPATLAAYLHKMEPYKTVSGEISFNKYGEIEGREIYTKIVVNGQFVYID